ncbi:proline iminopeptidase-family hydrolase [Rhodococcus aerolatus]
MQQRTEPPVRTGEMAFRGHRTWYRVTGDLEAPGRLPVVVLHGGPGAAHDYTLAMTSLAGDGRAVVHHDQLGCGRSTHLPDADPASWTPELFVAELAALVEHLGLGGGFHLLGQSWGGMLAPEYVLAHPGQGVRSLTICDSPASMPLWLAGCAELRAGLPADVAATLDRHEADGTTEHPDYLAAVAVFNARHVCRLDPWPDEVVASFAQIDEDPTVYHAMNGPNEFHVIGSLRDWSVVDRLGGIGVPTLVVAGAHDEATPSAWAPFVERVPDVRSHVFPRSSHMPHVEEPAAFTSVVGSFLRDHDPERPTA